MKTKTWPYGTTRKGVVEETCKPAQVVTDELGEGHVLVGSGCADFSAKKGDTGTLVFEKGGPLGGYWRFYKNSEQSA